MNARRKLTVKCVSLVSFIMDIPDLRSVFGIVTDIRDCSGPDVTITWSDTLDNSRHFRRDFSVIEIKVEIE